MADLTLTSMGTRDVDGDGDLDRVWRVRNSTGQGIPFTWDLYNTGVTGSGTAVPNADTFFSTDIETGTCLLYTSPSPRD